MPHKLKKSKKSVKKPQNNTILKQKKISTSTMDTEKEKSSAVSNPLTTQSAVSSDNDPLLSIHDRFDSMILSMNTQFDTLRSDLNASIHSETKTIQDSLDDFKLEIQGKFDNFKKEIDVSIKDIESTIDKHSNALDTHRSTLAVVNSEILESQIEINKQEQRQRNYSIKISGFWVESGSVGNTVYQKLILPTLKRAYDLKNPKEELPSYIQTCDIAHVLPTKPGRIPTIQFKFVTRKIREDFLKHKKAFLLEYNNTNSTSVEIKNDYTALNKACMSKLFENESVESFWMSGTTIKFTYKNDTSKIMEVKNPLEDDPGKMIIPP